MTLGHDTPQTTLKEIAAYFGIDDPAQVYQIILDYCNTNARMLLCSCDAVFRQAADEIYRTHDMLSGDGYVFPVSVPQAVVPITRSPHIYFLMDGNEVVYIGQTEWLLSRVATHIRGSHSTKEKQFDGVCVYPVSRDRMSFLEMLNIRHYRPKYNKDIYPNTYYFAKVLECCAFDMDQD